MAQALPYRCAGCRVQGAGCREQGAGCRLKGAGVVLEVSGWVPFYLVTLHRSKGIKIPGRPLSCSRWWVDASLWLGPAWPALGEVPSRHQLKAT